MTCPHCSQVYLASSPETVEPAQVAAAADKVPFFKFSRMRILREKLEELTKDGDYSAEDARDLFYEATRLKLGEKDLDSLRIKAVENAVSSIKARAEETWHLTDEDVTRIAAVESAFGTKIQLDDNLIAFRAIYELETHRRLPAPIYDHSFMTEPGESVYFRQHTAWAQLRVHRKGYSGVSVSVPSGIRGVRFRFGTMAPISSEELTTLAEGILYVTSRRLYFDGDRRNSSTTLVKITDFSLFKNALEIEKATGRSDIYYMDSVRARYIEALVRALRR